MEKIQENKEFERPTITHAFATWHTYGVFIIDKTRKGSAQIAKFVDCDDADGKTWLINLFVMPKYRRHGMATRIIETAKEYCLKRHIAALYLWCDKKMIPFYEKRGFEHLQTKFGSKGNSTYIMVCPIKQQL